MIAKKKYFPLTDKILPGDLSTFMDNNCTFKCKSSAYAFFTLSRKLKSFETGAFKVKKTDSMMVLYKFYFKFSYNLSSPK